MRVIRTLFYCPLSFKCNALFYTIFFLITIFLDWRNLRMRQSYLLWSSQISLLNWVKFVEREKMSQVFKMLSENGLSLLLKGMVVQQPVTVRSAFIYFHSSNSLSPASHCSWQQLYSIAVQASVVQPCIYGFSWKLLWFLSNQLGLIALQTCLGSSV